MPLGFPQPLAIYPLDKRTRGRDISPSKNPEGRLYNVKPAPGPYGKPDESTQFLGQRTSFIRFPNKGKLDTSGSISLLAWVYPEGKGAIFEYQRGVKFWVLRPDTLFVRFVRRDGRSTKSLSRRKLRRRQWHYVGATYDFKRGVASLWLDSQPIISRQIGRTRLSTNKAAYMGTGFRGRIACMQVYGVALNGPQMRKVKNMCNQPGKDMHNNGIKKCFMYVFI